jgi:hypothetical protein
MGNLMEGWTRTTLARVEGQWRIYTNEGKAFVPLEKASAELVRDFGQDQLYWRHY